MMKGLFLFALFLFSSPVFAGKAFPLRLASGLPLISQYAEARCDGFVSVELNLLPIFPAEASLGPIGTTGEGRVLRQRVQRTRRQLAESIRQARGKKLALCLMAEEIQFPKEIWKRLVSVVPDSTDLMRVDLQSDRFWVVYREKYREVMRLLPRDVRFVMLHTGTGPSDPLYAGQRIWRGKNDSTYVRDMVRLIAETRKIVVDEAGRTLIWRTFEPRRDGPHQNVAVYEKILAGLRRKNGLLVSLPEEEYGAWCYNERNPNLGRGEVNQMVEIQTSRPHEGWGAFPFYQGAWHAKVLRELRGFDQVGAVCCWGSDVLDGGRVKSDLWRRLHLETTLSLIAEPDRTPQAVLQSWLAQEFGVASSAALVQVFLATEECVRKAFYVHDYALRRGGWMSNGGLVVDGWICGEVHTGEGGIRAVYDVVKKDLSNVFLEKRDAMALAYAMRVGFEQQREKIVAEKGEAVYQEALTGFLVLQKITSVLSHYVRGMFLFYQWQENRDPGCARAASQELAVWKTAWADYLSEVPKLPKAPSCFRSGCGSTSAGGMEEACLRAMRELEQVR